MEDHAWIDESSRLAATGHVYVLAAVRSMSAVTDFGRRLSIEGRGPALDRRDQYTLVNARRAQEISRLPTTEFVGKAASPLLWVADGVASLASARYGNAKGSDHWWRTLRVARLTTLRIDLRETKNA